MLDSLFGQIAFIVIVAAQAGADRQFVFHIVQMGGERSCNPKPDFVRRRVPVFLLCFFGVRQLDDASIHRQQSKAEIGFEITILVIRPDQFVIQQCERIRQQFLSGFGKGLLRVGGCLCRFVRHEHLPKLIQLQLRRFSYHPQDEHHQRKEADLAIPLKIVFVLLRLFFQLVASHLPEHSTQDRFSVFFTALSSVSIVYLYYTKIYYSLNDRLAHCLT
nr:hypothetical protein [Cohnella fermenti]